MTTILSKNTHCALAHMDTWTIRDFDRYVETSDTTIYHPHCIALMFKHGVNMYYLKNLDGGSQSRPYYCGRILKHPEWDNYVSGLVNLIGHGWSFDDTVRSLVDFVDEELLLPYLFDTTTLEKNPTLLDHVVNYMLNDRSANNDFIDLLDPFQQNMIIDILFEKADYTSQQHQNVLHALSEEYETALAHWVQTPELLSSPYVFKYQSSILELIFGLKMNIEKPKYRDIGCILSVPQLFSVKNFSLEQRFYLFQLSLQNYLHKNSRFLGNIIQTLGSYIPEHPEVVEELLERWRTNNNLDAVHEYLRKPFFSEYKTIFRTAVNAEKEMLKNVGIENPPVEENLYEHLITLLEENGRNNTLQECEIHV